MIDQPLILPPFVFSRRDDISVLSSALESHAAKIFMTCFIKILIECEISSEILSGFLFTVQFPKDQSPITSSIVNAFQTIIEITKKERKCSVLTFSLHTGRSSDLSFR